ncbi:MAG: GGDEF domain-containing protein [Actinomycetota bacterium]
MAALILLPLFAAAMAGFFWSTKAARKLSIELNESTEQLRSAHIKFGEELGEAQRMAITDGLTSIWNHRYFKLQFEQELERAGRFGRPFSLIMLDVDDFKKFNDTYGHRVGDFVLVELTRRINGIIRDADIFARYGGEEFALMLPETNAAGGLATAEKIRRIIGGQPFEGEVTPEPLAVTVSLGVACSPEAGKDEDALFEAADKALLKAKAEGKNRVVLA